MGELVRYFGGEWMVLAQKMKFEVGLKFILFFKKAG